MPPRINPCAIRDTQVSQAQVAHMISPEGTNCSDGILIRRRVRPTVINLGENEHARVVREPAARLLVFLAFYDEFRCRSCRCVIAQQCELRLEVTGRRPRSPSVAFALQMDVRLASGERYVAGPPPGAWYADAHPAYSFATVYYRRPPRRSEE